MGNFCGTLLDVNYYDSDSDNNSVYDSDNDIDIKNIDINNKEQVMRGLNKFYKGNVPSMYKEDWFWETDNEKKLI